MSTYLQVLYTRTRTYVTSEKKSFLLAGSDQICRRLYNIRALSYILATSRQKPQSPYVKNGLDTGQNKEVLEGKS
jgi:hypothetical protein